MCCICKCINLDKTVESYVHYKDKTESVLIKCTCHIAQENPVLLSSCYGRTRKINSNNETITKPSDYRVWMIPSMRQKFYKSFFWWWGWLTQIPPPLPSQKGILPLLCTLICTSKTIWGHSGDSIWLRNLAFFFFFYHRITPFRLVVCIVL